MLEVLLIMCIVYAFQLMPLRGKNMMQLNPAQQQKVAKNFEKYMRTKKGKQTPNMTIEEYLPILQKQAFTYLIIAIVLAPIYVLAIVNIYLPMFV